MTALRAGETWLVVRGEIAKPCRTGGSPGAAVNVGSALAHVHVSAPWEEVPEAEWPDVVRRAAAGEWADPDV